MGPEVFFRAVLEAWRELPMLLGPAWSEVMPRLQALVERLAASRDPAERRALLAELILLFRPYELARARLQRAVQPMGDVRRGLRRGAELAPTREEGAAVELTTKLRQRLNPRYANVSFARHGTPSAVAKTSSLAAAAEYDLRMDIGPLSADSIVANAATQPFPSERLPPTEVGYWLEVVAVSDEFAVPERAYPMFLPRLGPSWVCDCLPGGEHTCIPDTRREHVVIPVWTQPEPGQAHIRIGIYYAKNLLQSQIVTSSIAATEQEGAGSSSWIDYTLTADLGDLSFLPTRDLHVLTNQNADGTHRVIVNGGRDGILPLNLAEGQIRDTLKATRQGLRQIHYEEWGGQLGSEPQRRTLLNRDNGKTKQAFFADLEQLARLGWKLFATVRPQQRPEAWDGLRAPAAIQVSRTRGSTFVFPWALVYDIPLETFAKPVPCPLIRDWDGRSAFVDSTARQCPREQDHGSKNALCPFGFWGYRHIIEQVPSMPHGWDLPLLIRVEGEPLELVVGRSLNLPTTATSAHLNALRRELGPRFTLQDCDSLAEIVRALAGPVELVYLYCHGRRRPLAGSDQQTPSLEVGNGEMFQPEDVLAWQQADWPPQHWLDTSPLVFINGCHTAEIAPESLVNFVDNFSAAYAAGVIGTEISLEQPMASEAAQVFFHHFKDGQVTVAEALQRMRIHFLLKGNVLGLAYTPYCSAELKLSLANA